MNNDKRVYPRFLFSEPVSYGFPEVSLKGGSVGGNISLSGIALRVQGFIPIGTILELQIRLGQSLKLVWVKAKVVRMRQVLSEDCYEIGLRFIKDEGSMKAIGMFLYQKNSLNDNHRRS